MADGANPCHDGADDLSVLPSILGELWKVRVGRTFRLPMAIHANGLCLDGLGIVDRIAGVPFGVERPLAEFTQEVEGHIVALIVRIAWWIHDHFDPGPPAGGIGNRFGKHAIRHTCRQDEVFDHEPLVKFVHAGNGKLFAREMPEDFSTGGQFEFDEQVGQLLVPLDQRYSYVLQRPRRLRRKRQH